MSLTYYAVIHSQKREKEKKNYYAIIYIYSWIQVTPSVTLSDIISLNNLLLDTNFDKSTVTLHYIHILFMLAKFHGN